MLQLISGTSANLLIWGIALFTFGLKAFALGDALFRKGEAFAATGKQTKTIWLAILGVALVINLVVFNPLSFLNIIGDVAALVYLLDVRPAIRALGDGGPYGRSRNDGPTGW